MYNTLGCDFAGKRAWSDGRLYTDMDARDLENNSVAQGILDEMNIDLDDYRCVEE